MPQPGLHFDDLRFPGVKFGRRLGRDENGEILEGVSASGASCVVKVLADASGPWLSELQAVAAAHVAGIEAYEVLRDGDRVALVRPHVDGQTLADRLERAGPLPWPQALELTRAIGSRLAALHAHGVVFGGLRPSNVLVARKSGAVHLLDVGLSRNGAASSIATAAPEQLQGGALTPAVDVYALAAVTHHMLTGEPLFTGTPQQVQLMHRFKEPRPVNQVLAGAAIPASIEAAILRGLAKDPQRRPSAAALVEELQGASDEAGVEATPTTHSRVPMRRPGVGEDTKTPTQSVSESTATRSAPEPAATESLAASLEGETLVSTARRDGVIAGRATSDTVARTSTGDEESPTSVFSRSMIQAFASEAAASPAAETRQNATGQVLVAGSGAREPIVARPPPPPPQRGRGFSRRPTAPPIDGGASSPHRNARAAASLPSPPTATNNTSGDVSRPGTSPLGMPHGEGPPGVGASPSPSESIIRPDGVDAEHQAEMTVILPSLKSLRIGQAAAGAVGEQAPRPTDLDVVSETVVTPMRQVDPHASSGPPPSARPYSASKDPPVPPIIDSPNPAPAARDEVPRTVVTPMRKVAPTVTPKEPPAPKEPPIDKTVVSSGAEVRGTSERTSPIRELRQPLLPPRAGGQTEVIRLHRPPEARTAEETVQVPGFGGEELEGSAAALARRRPASRDEIAPAGAASRDPARDSAIAAPAARQRSLRRRRDRPRLSFDWLLRLVEVIPRALGQLWRRMLQPFSRLQTLRTRLSMPLSSLRSSLTRITRLWSRWGS